MILPPSGVPAAATAGNLYADSRISHLRGWAIRYGFELLLIVGIAAALAWDRFTLCRQYLFRYTDEDQTCMWYAAHDLLHGRIAEPAFYGQDYNSCLEGFLAAPLVAMHVPYNVACPLVTVLLGLLPFILLSLVACRRGYFLTVAGVLLIPLILSNRFAMICGIPRGFVNGIAVAAIPMILLLPRKLKAAGDQAQGGAIPALNQKRHWLQVLSGGLQYFFAGALSVVAVQVNPNCVILLVPVAVYVSVTQFWDWKMWSFILLGVAVAAPYPWYVHQFYHVYHPDYILYLRDTHFGWGFSNFIHYLHFASPRSGPSPVFTDLVPIFVPGAWACVFLILAFGALAGFLLIRMRIAAVCAVLAGAAVMLVSFAYERVGIGEPSNTASYPYSRMWLAVPAVFAWLLFLLPQGPRPAAMAPKLTTWISRAYLAILLCTAICIVNFKQKHLPDAIDAELNPNGFVICPAVPVADLYAVAREVKKVADAQHADLLLVGGGDRQKHVAYAIPALLGLETIFPDFERRTFRLIEESRARHDKILIIFDTYFGAPIGGGRLVTLTADGTELPENNSQDSASGVPTHSFILPVITLIDAHGHNAYELPELSYWMPRLIHPDPTPGNPNPATQVYRPPWAFH